MYGQDRKPEACPFVSPVARVVAAVVQCCQRRVNPSTEAGRGCRAGERASWSWASILNEASLAPPPQIQEVNGCICRIR